MKTNIVFTDAGNKTQYLREVLTWLEADFHKRGDPLSGSFWNNHDVIEAAFDECRAMVALSRNKAVGFMIWAMKSGSDRLIEIDIVEVKSTYRRKGIFTNMLAAFVDKFTNVCVLSAHVLPQAEAVFRALGWSKTMHNQLNSTYSHYKIIRPVLPELTELPDGDAIAVFSQANVRTAVLTPEEKLIDAYRVMEQQGKYLKKYFKIDLDGDQKLRIPLIVPFHYEGYVGVYHDKKLIAEGKARYVFENMPCPGFLAIDRIRLKPQRQLTLSAASSSSTARFFPVAAGQNPSSSPSQLPVSNAMFGSSSSAGQPMERRSPAPSFAASFFATPPGQDSEGETRQKRVRQELVTEAPTANPIVPTLTKP